MEAISMNRRFDVYAAGLVDGEGCITAKSTKSGTGMGIRVLIGMSTKAGAILSKMRDTYGGTLITQTPKDETHSLITTWTVNGSTAATFLRAIEPHLILKVEQATIALKIEEIRTSQERIGTRDHYRWTTESMQRCEVLKRRLNELNERGRESSPTARTPFARLAAGQWVTDQADLFSDLGWEPYTETWPASGYMRDGQAFELPTSVPPIIGSGCSSLSHLPTPRASDPANASSHSSEGFRPQLGEVARTMLPTPQASDWKRENNPSDNLRKSPSITAVDTHFPTPTASDATGGGQHPSKRTGHTRQLIDTVLGLTGVPTLPLFDVGSE